MRDGGADLRFNVVADDRQFALFESALPIALRSDENRNAINKGATGIEDLFDIPFRRHFRTDRQIGDHHIGASFFKNADDVVGRSRRFFNDAFYIFAEAIVRHAAMHFHSQLRNFCKTDRVVRLGEDRFAQVAADLVYANVESGGKFDIAHVIAAEVHMHKAGDEIVFAGVTIKLDSLHEGGGAVADPDNSNSNLILHHSVGGFRSSSEPG